MKPWIRRALSVIVGLGLGWYVAGLAPTFLQAKETPVEARQDQGEQSLASQSADGHSSPAAMLVPAHDDVKWFGTMAGAAAGLFVAALVLGIPALRYKSPEPPTASSHDATSNATSNQAHGAAGHGH